MKRRLVETIGVVAVILAVAGLLKLTRVPTARAVEGTSGAPRTAWASPTCRVSGPTHTRRRCSGPRSMPTRRSSPTKSGPGSIGSEQGFRAGTSASSAAANATSPARTTRCSSRSSRQGGKRRSWSIRPTAGCLPRHRKRPRGTMRNESSGWRSSRQRKRARRRTGPAPAGHTARHHRGEPSGRRSTTRAAQSQ